jgi:hypothetical protein
MLPKTVVQEQHVLTKKDRCANTSVDQQSIVQLLVTVIVIEPRCGEPFPPGRWNVGSPNSVWPGSAIKWMWRQHKMQILRFGDKPQLHANAPRQH